MGWLLIETAPKDNTVIDLWVPDEAWRAANCSWSEQDGAWLMEEEHTLIDNPSHWMPLPDGPVSLSKSKPMAEANPTAPTGPESPLWPIRNDEESRAGS